MPDTKPGNGDSNSEGKGQPQNSASEALGREGNPGPPHQGSDKPAKSSASAEGAHHGEGDLAREQKRLSESSFSHNPEIRAEVASNPKAPREVLIRLASDTSLMVRGKVAENSSAPQEALQKLAKDVSRIQ